MVFATLAFVGSYGVASILCTIWECIPIPRVYDKIVPGRCLDLTVFWYANAASNIFSDIVILTLPMPSIRSLHLPRRQRVSLMLVFAIGGLSVIFFADGDSVETDHMLTLASASQRFSAWYLSIQHRKMPIKPTVLSFRQAGLWSKRIWGLSAPAFR